MSTDTEPRPVGEYLERQAGRVTVPSPNLGAVVARARRRRRRRTAGRAAIASVALVAATSAVAFVRQEDPREQVAASRPRAPQSTHVGQAAEPALDWQVARPARTIGRAWSSASLDDGTIFQLVAPTWDALFTGHRSPTLHRSSDALSWETVDLPDDFTVSDIAARGNALTAVGAAGAAGDEPSVRVARSSDGGRTWASQPIAFDVTDVEVPGMGPMRVANVWFAGGPVDAVIVVDLYAEADPAPDDESAPAQVGRSVVFHAVGGAPFERVAEVANSAVLYTPTSPLVRADDGYWLAVDSGERGKPRPVALHSSTGAAWGDRPIQLRGEAHAMGVIRGRAAIVTSADFVAGPDAPAGKGLGMGLELLAAAGAQRLDLDGVVPGGLAGVGDAGFGPLGLAVVVSPGEGPGPSKKMVLHSLDGKEFSVAEVPPGVDGDDPLEPTGIVMAHDRIVIGLGGPTSFVGTPR